VTLGLCEQLFLFSITKKRELAIRKNIRDKLVYQACFIKRNHFIGILEKKAMLKCTLSCFY
jgi:hypothetical protein